MAMLVVLQVSFDMKLLDCKGNSRSTPYLSGSDVPDVNAFILIERDGAASGEDFDLDRGRVFNGTPNHPTVTGIPIFVRLHAAVIVKANAV